MSLKPAIGLVVLYYAMVLLAPAVASAQVTDCVSCTTYGVEVTPDGTTTASVPISTGGFRTFTVQNTGNATDVFTLVGSHGLFQGYVRSNEPVGICCGLTLGSSSVQGEPGLSKAETKIFPTTLAAHEYGHTMQFLFMSGFGNPWKSYLTLGALGTFVSEWNPWENLASLAGYTGY